MLRKFETGALRDTGNGKFEYYGFRHPLCEHSFAGYMHQHREMKDGSLRASNNWWGGWDKGISLQSLNRHLEDLNAIHAGYRVFKERVDGAEFTHILQPGEVPQPLWEEVFEEGTCNAIRFNSDAYKLQLLQNKS